MYLYVYLSVNQSVSQSVCLSVSEWDLGTFLSGITTSHVNEKIKTEAHAQTNLSCLHLLPPVFQHTLLISTLA